MKTTSIFIVFAVIIALFVGCTQTIDESDISGSPAPSSSFSAGETENSTVEPENTDSSTPGDPTEEITPTENRTPENSKPADEKSNISTSSATSKSTNTPVISQPDTLKPPTTSQPTDPPATSTPPTTSTPTSEHPAPAYEVMGLDFQNEVLRGLNERRAAWGLAPARLDSVLSAECLVQAKKMADAGNVFHSEMPTGCEGCSRVPYNHPADLIGDVMCTHVPDFLYESNVRVGIAVVKKGNYLYTVIQGAP